MDLHLQTDSADFTVKEADTALFVENVDGVIKHLKAQKCQVCSNSNSLFPTLQEQRRLAGVLYWRVALACARMHEESLVFKVRSHQQSQL